MHANLKCTASLAIDFGMNLRGFWFDSLFWIEDCFCMTVDSAELVKKVEPNYAISGSI